MVSFIVITTILSYFDKTQLLLIQKYINNQQMPFFILPCIQKVAVHLGYGM
jgi:hypothetical protein